MPVTGQSLLCVEMNKDQIKEIGIDELERLYVRPQAVVFPFVYREAMEINWDENKRSLYSPKPIELSYFDWFIQVFTAAKEQGCLLQISDKTSWVNIPGELKYEITIWSKGQNA